MLLLSDIIMVMVLRFSGGHRSPFFTSGETVLPESPYRVLSRWGGPLPCPLHTVRPASQPVTRVPFLMPRRTQVVRGELDAPASSLERGAHCDIMESSDPSARVPELLSVWDTERSY